MIEDAIKKKLQSLVERGRAGSRSDMDNGIGSWEGWLTESLHVVELIFPDSGATYRYRIEEIMDQELWSPGYKAVAISSMLRGLLEDIELGLITKLSNKIKAETFDDFLDHAEEYRSKNRKNEAGVIAGVVFEDTIRRVYREKIGESDVGKSLEDLINALTKRQIITAQQSKQAKVAAHVRTKATHAQWEEFDLSGVEATIHVTRRMLGDHLGA